ncbi:Ku70/Ku80 beta-barrel domain-containing protein [Artemisia annua]|uniref:ATP-dependent DNA helicase 2 subunit KU80 n=1 Tax=Artemisia annua TaxID=35608 RepID=A0A2U1LRW3_ARTAN|nr:Ku70/Ku80 beta-barrel domain-containing protein [Artemisia annua]
MHSVLPEIQKVCSLLIQKKLVYSKYDEVGVVVFGTKDTENDLTNEVGGYEHVTVLQPLKVVDGDLVDVVQQFPRGTVPGDFMDAVVVGMDMLIKKHKDTMKGKKRICLITNAMHPIKDPYEGTKEDQVYTIAEQMTAHGMRIDCTVFRGNQNGNTHDNTIIEENDMLLSIFSKKTKARAVRVESSTSLLGALRTRNVTPVTTYRGDLEISSALKLKVWVYKKTAEEKFPTLKKYSDKAPPTDKFATHEIKLDYDYKSVQDPNKVVPPEQRIKGYKYGPQVIPISSDVFEAVKFKPEKGVKLLGFTNAQNIRRHYYMKDVNIFIAEPGNKKAIMAVSALARAMKEMNKVAIVRCVWRQGQANVVVGVLTPNVSDMDNIADSFYFNVIPFAEDVREFQFPSFSNFPASVQPNAEQQEAADKLVMMLDLAPAGKEEALRPDFTPNPVLERFYHHLELKSKDPDAAVPPLDATLKRITEPDLEAISQNKLVIDEFCRRFELKENPKLKKSTRRLLREKPSGSFEGGVGKIEDQSTDGVASTSTVKIETIGDLTPVQDFEAMISRRDSPEWVSKAIYGMKNKVIDLVESSYEGDTYPKALECLVALRKGCVIEQEPKQFNNFLGHIFRFCHEKDLSSFCEFLASKDVKYITKTEAEDSEIEAGDASSWFAKPELNSSN